MTLPPWRRLVLKIGSNLIAPGGQALSTRHVLDIARFVQVARSQDREVLLVSSGAVAAGRAAMAQRAADAPAGISGKQALAAIGQAELMRFWARFFDFPVAQLLLTQDDLAHRRRYLNARNTLRSLRGLGVLPVINENDSVAVDELRVGDNDSLAGHVAVLAEADLMVLVTDIDGLYDADPRKVADARKLVEVDAVTEEILALAGGAGSLVGTGGMRTKLLAARRCAEAGIGTVICDGRNGDTLMRLLQGRCEGSYVRPAVQRRAARKHWMLHALPTSGVLRIDPGAAEALAGRGASLLPRGVLDCEGQFDVGDAVEVHAGEQTVAKGIVQYRATELSKIRGRHSREIVELLGECPSESVIHRDDLVLL
ncbi:glutamate 5-kinase [Pseudomarimonas salicorniae]|uniref:Glutamate 5-kinase n=1 Tax=Pseudomarimonas salicorniae TaxID=2933270 RepID=A0ABT0GJT4_9GAMM|nr:glutamate 5-kinase [Lysobacter sp. CAU 1642]MCK7594814.1 glutamate 5-kinase [Lysobacter sp. CAU 1642]